MAISGSEWSRPTSSSNHLKETKPIDCIQTNSHKATCAEYEPIARRQEPDGSLTS